MRGAFFVNGKKAKGRGQKAKGKQPNAESRRGKELKN